MSFAREVPQRSIAEAVSLMRIVFDFTLCGGIENLH
jgi:hypothetical protein